MCCENILAEVRNVGKSYQIYSTPARRLLQTLCMGRKQFYSTFQALEQISFTVKRGECLGIIGRNGAGKSTLLQLLCGTLEPTCGEIVLHGKISALLELGFGFNPDFTGRANIFLSGLIHGLSREQIAERLEDIIHFAEIGEFIDQPVKQYSSGMFVRLAFAVAAHVESEILLIDEALAVGDIFFQQKCYRYLEEQRARKAVILVSHDLNAIASLCSRIIVLDKGRVAFAGAVNEGIECYTHLLYPGEVSAAAKEIPAEMYPVPPDAGKRPDFLRYPLAGSGAAGVYADSGNRGRPGYHGAESMLLGDRFLCGKFHYADRNRPWGIQCGNESF